jgi:transposase-like protein
VYSEKPFDLFIESYEQKYPKAALCLQKDREELMVFFYFPAQHWQSIRTSNLPSRQHALHAPVR